MELLISIVLIALMVSYLYNILGVLKTSNASISKKDADMKRRDFIFQLLYKDLFESSSIKIATTEHKDFDILKVVTKNSLHDLINPNIVYIVTKEDKKFIRLESNTAITLPIPLDSAYTLYADELTKDVEFFKVYNESKENNESKQSQSDGTQQTETAVNANILINLKLRNEKPIFFEIAR